MTPTTDGWTIKDVMEYVVDLLVERDKRYEQRFLAAQEAVVVALAAQRELDLAESKRIDAIHIADMNTAVVLARQVSESAETLRTLVATTANTTAEQLRQLTALLTDRIAALEKAQYEGAGGRKLSSTIVATVSAVFGGLVLFLLQRGLK